MEIRSRSRARSQSTYSNYTEATVYNSNRYRYIGLSITVANPPLVQTSILKRIKGPQTTDFTNKRVRFNRSILVSDTVVNISKDSDRGRKKANKRTSSVKRVSKPKRSALKGSEQL